MPSSFDLPSTRGTYILELSLSFPLDIPVGAKGLLAFPAGIYLYAGSALGPGGLKSRLGRYLNKQKTIKHWHIDYLIPHTEILGYFYIETTIEEHRTDSKTTPIECVWSQALEAYPGIIIPVRGFGASDCRMGCSTHLLALPDTSSGSTPQEIESLNLSILKTLSHSSTITPAMITHVTPQSI